jgi:hypothetical protein
MERELQSILDAANALAETKKGRLSICVYWAKGTSEFRPKRNRSLLDSFSHHMRMIDHSVGIFLALEPSVRPEEHRHFPRLIFPVSPIEAIGYSDCSAFRFKSIEYGRFSSSFMTVSAEKHVVCHLKNVEELVSRLIPSLSVHRQSVMTSLSFVKKEIQAKSS